MTDDALRLRAVEDADLDLFFEHQADPVAAQIAAFPPRNREQFDAHWARIRHDATGTIVLRTIVAGGVVAGGITSWVDDGRRLVGYWIGREHWGRGIATRALRLLLAEVAERPVHAYVVAGNAGSIRVLQKGGFRLAETGSDELTFILEG